MASDFDRWCERNSAVIRKQLGAMPQLHREQTRELMRLAFVGGWVTACDRPPPKSSEPKP